MADKAVLERVKAVTARVLGLDPAEIKDNAAFVTDLGAESVQSVELMAAFEEEFEIEMDQDEALSHQTIDQAAEYIGSCMKK